MADPASPVLPAAYGVDRVLALPCDPHRLLVLWEVSAQGAGRAKDAMGRLGAGARLVLRVADDRGASRDVPVTDWVGRRSVDGLTPGAAYVAAVGFLGADCFAPVAVSPPAPLPRHGPP